MLHRKFKEQELRVRREWNSYESCAVSLKSIVLVGWMDVKAILRTVIVVTTGGLWVLFMAILVK